MPETEPLSLDMQLAIAIGDPGRWVGHGWTPRPYSTDGNAMLELIDVMRERGWQIWHFQNYVHAPNQHFVEFTRPSEERAGHGDSFPLATATAALAALSEGEKDA